MSSRKTAGRKAGYVRRRAGSTREKGRRALSLILAVLMVMASSLDAIPAKAAGTILTDVQNIQYEVLDASAKTVKVIGPVDPYELQYNVELKVTGIKLSDNNTYTITEVGDGAFANCTSLPSISFPSTVTKFGTGVLDGCKALKSVTNYSKTALKLPDMTTLLGSNTTYAWWDSKNECCVDEVGGTSGCTDIKKEEKAYIITFDAQGGTFSNGKEKLEQRVLYGHHIAKPEEPVREGYIFLGWDTGLNIPYDQNEVQTYNGDYHTGYTIKAKWTETNVETKDTLYDGYSGKVTAQKNTPVHFLFIPQTTDVYTLTCSDFNATIVLFKNGIATEQMLEKDTLALEYELTAGEIYYYRIINSKSFLSANITLESKNGGTVTPTKTDISGCDITLDKTDWDYTGDWIKPTVTVKYGSAILNQGTDYTVEYKNNRYAGQATVTVTGTNQYEGSKSVNFQINKISAPNPPKEITVPYTTATVGEVSLSAYSGWSWSKTDQSKALTEGAVTTATAVYEDTDNYKDTSVSVKITRQANPVTPLEGILLSSEALSIEKGNRASLTASPSPETAALENITWKSSDDSVAEVSGTGATVTIIAKQKGTADITVQSGSVSAQCKVTVTASNLSSSGDFTFSALKYGYSSPTKTVTISNNGDAAASEIKASLSAGTGSNFTISATPSSTLEVNGQTTVSVLPKSGLNVGNYSDTLVISYKGGTDIEIPVSFTVEKQTVTVKADDREITYGDNLPTDFYYQITPAGITGLKVSCAVKNVPEIPETGTYPIEVSVENDNSNYKINCQNGTLTVKQKTVSDAEIVFPVAGNITMGQQLKESVLSGGSTQYGTFAWENETEALSTTGNNKKNVVLTLNETSKKNCSFTGVTGYDSAKGTITREIDIYVGRADMPSIEFPSGLTAVYGMSLKDISLPESESGKFTWKLPETELNQVGEREYTVVFEWSEAVKNTFGLSESELKFEKNITIMIEKAANPNVPQKPVLSSRTASTISVQGQEGVEYSLDQSKWTGAGNGDFQNLSPFTEYTIYARYAATETHKESQPGETLVVYTLVANPYEIDLSKIGDANYREALYTEYNANTKHPTISYDDSSRELTLLDSVDVYGNGYILTGNAADVTVKTGNSGRYNITMENAAMKKLELSGKDTDLELPGNSTSTVSEGIHAQNNLTVSGPGKLAASEIEVSNGNLRLQNLTAEIGPSAAGKAALSAEEVAITDGSKVTATGGAGAPAIEANGSITLKDSDIKVETDGTPETPAIFTNDTAASIVVENTKVSSESCENLYSQTPENEKGEPIDPNPNPDNPDDPDPDTPVDYTVTLQYRDGEKEEETIKEGGSYTLPLLEEEYGYRMTWQDESKHSYQPGDTVTVNSDMTFTQVADPIKVTQITLDSTAETIEVGDGVALAETVMPEDALDDSVSWSSSNPKVATVNQDGEVSGIAPGTAVITVTAKDGSGVSARCTITVVSGEIEVTKVKITGDTKKVAPGKKLKLEVTVSPSNATDKSVKWEVSNSKYASVNSKGVVTTKKAGAGKKVTVTAVSNSSGEEATYTISIMKKAVKKIKLTASKKTLKKKKSVTIKAKFTPSSGISKELTWTSSNKKVATVNSKGKVTAKKKGKAKITAKAKDGSGKKATITIKVK